ncbi:hypothetical protein BC831DRAFT_464114 [Entophlyctis helioformis]|nr:hypothetical protein BC831DRAFT_464114 [Entophlyctis helioformis]
MVQTAHGAGAGSLSRSRTDASSASSASSASKASKAAAKRRRLDTAHHQQACPDAADPTTAQAQAAPAAPASPTSNSKIASFCSPDWLLVCHIAAAAASPTADQAGTEAIRVSLWSISHAACPSDTLEAVQPVALNSNPDAAFAVPLECVAAASGSDSTPLTILAAKTVFDTSSGMFVPCLLIRRGISLVLVTIPYPHSGTASCTDHAVTLISSPIHPPHIVSATLLDGPAILLDNGGLLSVVAGLPQSPHTLGLPHYASDVVGCWTDLYQDRLHFLVKATDEHSGLAVIQHQSTPLQSRLDGEPPQPAASLSIPDFVTDAALNVDWRPDRLDANVAVWTASRTLAVFTSGRLSWAVDLSHLVSSNSRVAVSTLCQGSVVVVVSDSVSVVVCNGHIRRVDRDLDAVWIDKSRQTLSLIQNRTDSIMLEIIRLDTVCSNLVAGIPAEASRAVDAKSAERVLMGSIERQLALARRDVSDLLSQITSAQHDIQARRQYIASLSCIALTDPDRRIAGPEEPVPMPGDSDGVFVMPFDVQIVAGSVSCTVDADRTWVHVRLNLRNVSAKSLYNASVQVHLAGDSSAATGSGCWSTAVPELGPDKTVHIMCRVSISVQAALLAETGRLVAHLLPVYRLAGDDPMPAYGPSLSLPVSDSQCRCMACAISVHPLLTCVFLPACDDLALFSTARLAVSMADLARMSGSPQSGHPAPHFAMQMLSSAAGCRLGQDGIARSASMRIDFTVDDDTLRFQLSACGDRHLLIAHGRLFQHFPSIQAG